MKLILLSTFQKLTQKLKK